MTNLALLRRKLALLRRRRFLRRFVCGAAPVGTGFICFLVAMFISDFLFQLDVVQRTVAMGTGLLLLGWFLRRSAWPYLRVRESVLQTALDFERIHGIDSQLVAALQFELADASRRSSPQLERAVIDDARAVTQDLDALSGFQYRPMVRRIVILLAMVLWSISVTISFPEHTRAFFRRLVWQPVRYPTGTVVQGLVINGHVALIRARDATQPRPVDCPEGAPVEFSIQTSGTVPEQGSLRLATLDGQQLRTIPLTLDRDAPSDLTDGSEIRLYRGRLRRLATPLRYQVYLGDAWTDSAELKMIARPVIAFAARIQPPQYTAAATSIERSARQLSVLEGSEVRFQINSTNGKRLRAAELSWQSGTETSRHRFVQVDGDGLQWVLRPEQTLFAAVRDEVRFEVQVTDEDGLGLERPLSGVLAVRPDRAPSVMIRSIHRVVLPSAEPVIDFQISDDFAVESAVLHVRSNSAEPNVPRDGDRNSPTSDEYVGGFEIPLGASPISAERLPLDGRYALDLAALALEKDDRLMLTLEVMDGRGARPGVSSTSEPLILQVTDEQGVLAAISQVDEQAERDLSEVIQRQLEVGGR